MRRPWIRAALAASIGLIAIAGNAGSALPAPPVTPHAMLMSFTYGRGTDQVDTTGVDPNDPLRTVVQSYRVNPDETVWILTGHAGTQTLRRLRSVAGLARVVEQIPLPAGRGLYNNFIFVPGGIVLSQLLIDPTRFAAFYRFERGKGIVEQVSLPRDAGYNRFRGQQIANLGRLRIVADTLYNCFDRNGSCLRIGAGRLFRRLTARDVLIGAPTASGLPVWSDRMRVFFGIAPIVDLSHGGPSVIEEVFEDGSFVIERTLESDSGGDGSAEVEQFEMYNADGRMLRTIVIPRQDPDCFGVGDGDALYFTIPWIYRVSFGRFGVELERY